MWIWTQAKNSDGHAILLDLSKVETVAIVGPEVLGETKSWRVVASRETNTWTLAETTTLDEAIVIHRRVYHSLASGEKALNLHTHRRNADE